MLASPDDVTTRLDPALPSEGYTLEVTPAGVVITGGSPAGVFYGRQTLRQLLPPASLRRARIGDEPLAVAAR